MKIDRFISVIAPLYNDEDIIESYIKETIEVLSAHFSHYELILINDGSTDNTVNLINKLLKKIDGIRLLCLSRSFGQEIAISAGLDTVIGDYTVVMLPGMDSPTLIPQAVNLSISGADIVFGLSRTTRHQNWLVRKSASLFYWYCRQRLGLDLVENSTSFCCLSRQVVNAVTQIKDTHRYLRLLNSYVGYLKKPLLYEPNYSLKRKQEQRFLPLAKKALSIVIENSPHPLRLVYWLGLWAAASNLVYIFYVWLVHFIKNNIIPGWTTLSLQLSMQFFLLSLMVAVLAEYTGRILTRLRDRPLYYIMQEYNSSVLLFDPDRPNVVENLSEVE